MSLRIKFLGLLVVIPSLCLALFLYFAVSTFVSDKATNLLETQFQLLNSANLYLKDSLNIEEKFLSGIQSLSKQEGFDSLLVIDTNGVIKQSNKANEIGKNISEVLGHTILNRLVSQTNEEGSFEERDFSGERKLVSFLRIQPNFLPPADKTIVANNVAAAVVEPVTSTTLTIEQKSHKAPTTVVHVKSKALPSKLPKKGVVTTTTLPPTTTTTTTSTTLPIPSPAEVKPVQAPLVLLLQVDKSGATRATLIFLLKSISTLVALVSLAVVVSIVFSNKLTFGIRSLSNSMLAFEKGDFDSPLPKLEDDEVGQMAKQFGSMREQIKKLILEQQEKAKIETEMRLAGSLQKRFFPTNQYQTNGVDLSAYFEPASDAGGDWWFYFQKDDLFIFVIGDVTGHGLNSAMITGVSRSAFSLIEQKYESTSESLRLLNKAIFDAAKGELMMTALVGCLNLKTGELKAANASHEVPFIIPAENGDLKKSQMKILDTEPGPRLGEKSDSTYQEISIQLEDNETLVLYSDGLTELKDAKGENFGERRLIKVIGTDHYKELSSEEILTKIKTQALKHRMQTELADDLSFMIIKKTKIV